MKSIVTIVAVAALLAPLPLFAQDGDPADLTPTALLRTGFGFEPEASITNDGFFVYDARVGLRGQVGFVFDYLLGVEYHRRANQLRLLDAALSFPIGGSSTSVDVGAFRSPFGREATRDKASLAFLERSQAALALAPGRQLGAQVRGELLDTRLKWLAGLFNGDGVRFDNASDGFLGVARVEFNSVGDVEFYEDFVIEAGVSAAVSTEAIPTAVPTALSPTDIRLARASRELRLFQGDLRLAYIGWLLLFEYHWAEFEDPFNGSAIGTNTVTADIRRILWGAFDLGVRYDGFRTPALLSVPAQRNDFLVFGLNVNAGLYARIGLQYAVGLDGAVRGVFESADGTSTAPPLADGQFLLFLQAAF
jgi:hypothetical protein